MMFCWLVNILQQSCLFLGLRFEFVFVFTVHSLAIRDMIGRGMTCGDVMTNSFAFSHESH